MRGIIGLLVILYLIGVGVELAPVVQAEWNTGTAATFTGSILSALPDAMGWPAKVYRSVTSHP